MPTAFDIDEKDLELDYDSDAVSEPDEQGFSKSKPIMRTGLENAVICDGIPVVGEERLGKLITVLQKVFGQFGNVSLIQTPKDPKTDMTIGYVSPASPFFPPHALLPPFLVHSLDISNTQSHVACLFSISVAFVEFSNPKEAAEAAEKLDNYKLDKQHTFRTNLYSDMQKFLNVPDQYEPPVRGEYKPKVIFIIIIIGILLMLVCEDIYI
jgi:translation initiation factor 3 subunit B